MIINFKINNFKLFPNDVSMSFIADMRIKKFTSNTISKNNLNILKVAGIYGPNNTGKTCLILALNSIKNIMLGENTDTYNNSFFENKITEIEIEYEMNNSFYKYFAKYDSIDRIYMYERLEEKNNNTYVKIFEKKEDGLHMKLDGRKITFDKRLYSDNYPILKIIKLSDTNLEKMQLDYLTFANSIQLLKMDNQIDITKTINLLKTNQEAKSFITSFIKNCDLNIEDFGLSEDIISDVDISNELNKTSINKDALKLWSKHYGYTVPSAFYDSVGTQKIIALAGYIYDAFKNGKILLIDEIDSSLHHVITRAIIALFNNELNTKAQLVFSTQDALLMDLRRLFRKDQIWLTDITDNNGPILIHLSEKFTSRDSNGIRGDEDITDFYLKGRFGGIPTPDLFDTLFDLLGSENIE